MMKKMVAVFTALIILMPFIVNNHMEVFSENLTDDCDDELKEFFSSDDIYFYYKWMYTYNDHIVESSEEIEEQYYAKDGTFAWVIDYLNCYSFGENSFLEELKNEWDKEWYYEVEDEWISKYSEEFDNDVPDGYYTWDDFCKYQYYSSKIKNELDVGEYKGIEYIVIPDNSEVGKHIMVGHFSREAGKDIVMPDEIDDIPVTFYYSSPYYSNAEPIRSIKFSDNITNIENVFSGCPNIEKVVLPKKLENISNAFYDCPKLETIAFSDKLELIEGSFSNCPSLKKVELPESLNIIDSSFSYTALTSIIFPDSLEIIEYGSFSYCLNLEDVKLSGNICSIDHGAFAYTKIRSIDIPASVSYLGNSSLVYYDLSFWECPYLTNVNIDKDNECFYDVNGIPYVRETDEILFIPRQRIDEFEFSTEIITNYTSYPEYTYKGFEYIIVDGRYVQITGLENNDLRNVVIPDKIAGFPVRTIGKSTFNRSLVESVEFPDKITELDNICNECTKLKSVKLPANLVSLSNSFNSCPNLTSIELPDTLVYIDGNSFSDSGLISIDIPASVEDIGSDSDSFLDRCQYLEAVNIDEKNQYYYDVDGVPYVRGTDELLIIPLGKSGELHFPDDFDDFESVFIGTNKNITSLSIDEKNKNYKAVDGCIYTRDGKELVLVPSGISGDFYVPETVERIGCAFQNVNLKKLVIPSGVKELSNLSLTGNVDELIINSDEISMKFNEYFGSYRNTIINKYTASSSYKYDDMLTLNIGSGELALPGNCTYEGNKIKGLKKLSFGAGDRVEILSLPNYNVISELDFSPDIAELYIAKGADVKELVLPDGKNIIGDKAFSRCATLRSLTINGTAEIGEGAFRSCSSLKTIDFKKKVKLSDSVFAECNNLENVSIPLDSELNGDCFNNCFSLMKINDIEVVAENRSEFAPELDGFIRKNFCQSSHTGFIDRWIKNMSAHVVSEVTNEKMTDIEKVKALHDWILKNTVYEFDDDNYPENHIDSSVFMDGVAVCEGYARTFNLLLNEAGIETVYVETVDHAWNIVKVDGKYFHIDSTWDDLMSSYQWFMVSDEQILQPNGVHDNWKVKMPSKLHKFQSSKLPVCNTAMGDMNGDGKLSQEDIKMLRTCIVKDEKYTISADLDFNGKLDTDDMETCYKNLSIIMGDVNEDGEVGLADALRILQYTANSRKYPLTENGIRNADVYDNGDGVTPLDALAIQQKDARMISKLPCSYIADGKRLTAA